MNSLPTPPRLGQPLPPAPASSRSDASDAEAGAAEGLNAGDLLDGHYKIEEQIGEGGVGAVYRAVQLKLHRRVAVKLLLQDVVGEEELRPRFEQEALTLAALSHPNIVNMQDYGVANGRPYLVMELLEGRTLREILDQEGALTPLRALSLIRQLVLALAYAHELGIVHRDLKPANLIVQSFPGYEHVKVLDFGMVKLMPGSYLDRGAQLTRIGFTFGTPAYMSPEHALGGDVDGRSDLYSVGILLFEMLSGQKPFEGEIHDILRHHLASPVPSLSSLRPELAEFPELQHMVERALAKERDERYADAPDLLRVIDELLMSGLLVEEPEDELEQAEGRASFAPKVREALEAAASALQAYARAGRATWRGRAAPQLASARRELRELATQLAPALRGLPSSAWSGLSGGIRRAARRIARLALATKARLDPRRSLPSSPPEDEPVDAEATIVDEPRFAGPPRSAGPVDDASTAGAHAPDDDASSAGSQPEPAQRSAADTADPLLLEPREPNARE